MMRSDVLEIPIKYLGLSIMDKVYYTEIIIMSKNYDWSNKQSAIIILNTRLITNDLRIIKHTLN